MDVGLNRSIELHQNKFFEIGGCIPIASSITGTCRIVAAVGLISFQGMLLVHNTLLALGEMIFTDETKFQRDAVDNVRVIFYNIMQILHGVMDAIPLLGNIPYWIKAACKEEQDQVAGLLPPPPLDRLATSIEWHQNEFFELGGCIPIASSITGTCRIAAAVGLISFHGMLLLINAPVALGEMIFTNKTGFQRDAVDNIGVIFYNVMQIVHGAIDVIPIIGNIPYWIKAACKEEQGADLALPLPPPPFLPPVG